MVNETSTKGPSATKTDTANNKLTYFKRRRAKLGLQITIAVQA